MGKIISIIAFLIIPLLGVSQTNVEFVKSNFKKDRAGLKKALLDIEDGDYYYNISASNSELAIKYYLRANEFNPNNALLNYKIGLCYIEVKPISKSFEYFDKAKKLNPKVNSKYYYYYARALQLDLQFAKAISVYQKYKGGLEPRDYKMMNPIVNKNIQECKLGVQMIKNPVRVRIDNLGAVINSEYSDYGAVVNIDESMMFYTSRRDINTGGERSPVDMMFFEDAYLAFSKDGKWLVSNNMGKPINTRYHDAVVGVAPDGNTLILYRDDNGGDLYYSQRRGNKWLKPKAFSSPINSAYQETSASFSYNGKRLYFVSNRPGGYGGKDLYYCNINSKGEFSKPINFGNSVNTKENELGIFAHADGKTIYFSSTGHEGLGGYDVYKTVMVDGEWSKPINLGYPINSPNPEVFFSIGASGRNAYYSTSRKGGYGSQDIYKIVFLGPKKMPQYSVSDKYIASDDAVSDKVDIENKVQLQSSQLTLLKGIVLDELTQQPIEATVELIDNEAGEVLATFRSNSLSGKYVVSLPSGNNYGLAIYADGYLFYSDNFEIPKFETYKEVVRNVNLQRIEIGSSIALNNIFFEYKKSNVSSDSKMELNRIVNLMNKYPNLRVEIDGHTDNIGSEDYNNNLSYKRSASVVDYIVKKGIDKSRLVSKGFGFSKPLADNNTEEGRKKNRRSEIIIIAK